MAASKVKLETQHTIAKGISRLCTAFSTDLAGEIPKAGKPRAYAKASKEHQKIFDDYLKELNKVLPVAAKSWSKLIDKCQKKGMTREDAIGEAIESQFAGPASTPAVIDLVRQTWLKCAALNAASKREVDRVPPEIVLLGWLVDANHEACIQLITSMPYWPIGLDKEGEWC